MLFMKACKNTNQIIPMDARGHVFMHTYGNTITGTQ